MRTNLKLLCLVPIALLWIAPLLVGFGPQPGLYGGAIARVVRLSQTMWTNGKNIVNNVLLTGDVAPVSAYEDLGGDASPFATTGASQIGAASTYRGGCGTTNIKAVDCPASAAGKTVTLAGYKSDGTAWTETYTEGAGGALGWDRGATQAACATNLAATIDAAPIAKLYVDASAGGAGGVFVGVQLKPGMNADCPTISTNAGVGVLLPVNGADGNILIPPMNGTTPNLRPIGSTTTGIGMSDAVGIVLQSAGTSCVVGSGNLVCGSGILTAGTWLRATANATLGNCAAAGDVGKIISYLKTNVTHLCYCKQTGAGTYAWTSVFAGGDCT